ncbi:SAM-dependent methyltransferase [Anaerobacillus alkaliphilus]|uniref:SAM-dependent methyltransferase n=1 Tax=Anaerobacillus alkaliphilus TaxID=1548597 RepID=A0A4Q0VVP8_9BACI|nr:class I SAM-dependent methyltransferase [Anaerobacillus alkaliphilus]RXJ02465.1 SAM-dependent methyltransferase [Anaerobacillus alkaliphilus]
MDNTHKFNGKAGIYSLYRPDYPDQLIKDIIEEFHLNKNSLIADIGSGTGIFSKKLLKFQLQVVAVEPNEEMRDVAKSELNEYTRFTSINGTAENTTLEANSIDIITVAQAFHWFNQGKFKKECQRILKPGGKVFIVFNNRDIHSDVSKEIISIFKKYCSDFRGFSNGIEEDLDVYNNFFTTDYSYNSYDFPLLYDKSSFIGRHLSASYALKEGDPLYPQFLEEFSNLFDFYQKDGILHLPNVTKSYWGSV